MRGDAGAEIAEVAVAAAAAGRMEAVVAAGDMAATTGDGAAHLALIVYIYMIIYMLH